MHLLKTKRSLITSFLIASMSISDPFSAKRNDMVRRDIESRGVSDVRVLESMNSVPRHLFVPDEMLYRSYDDSPLPIGEGQTISQPYIVALMAEAAKIKIDDKVLGDFAPCETQENDNSLCYHYTPVPKGIGPMTVASLMQNVLKAYKLSL
jgi:hypothetical protein